MADLQALYANRFSQSDETRKNRIWVEISRYLRKFIQKDAGIVVDVAAGYCDFINNINVGTHKFALDLNPDVREFAASDVTAIVGDVEESMRNAFKENSVSLFFMSNFLEHIPKEKISTLLELQYKLLRCGGGGCLSLLRTSNSSAGNTGTSSTISRRLRKARSSRRRRLPDSRRSVS